MSQVRDTIVSLAGLCVIGLTGYLVYDRVGIEEGHVESYCNYNMMRGGACSFTVDSQTSGRHCVDVSLTNILADELKTTTTVCSGLVGPLETKNVAYFLDVQKACDGDLDDCRFDVK